MKTSIVHNTNYPKHKHKMVIWDSFELYANCSKCGFHDWDDVGIDGLKKKYPEAKVIDINEELIKKLTKEKL